MADTNSSSSRARQGGPKVIGTGLPRTGTTSLYLALETLGFTPCHHFRRMPREDSFPYRQQRLWAQAARTENKEERQEMLHLLLTDARYGPVGGYRAAVDYPTSCFVEDLVEMYPDAKFVHAERTSPQAWTASFNGTIGRMLQDPFLYYATYLVPFLRFGIVPVLKGTDERNQRLLGASIYSFDSQVDLYHRHNANVRKVVPEDKLLVLDLKKGYEPLCEFLGVDVPVDEKGEKMKFPHVNESEDMKQGLRFAMITGCVIWSIAIGGVYFGYRMLAK